MGKTAKDIKAATGIEDEKVAILADELDRIHELKMLFRSEGGKALLARLQSNCEAALRGLYAADHREAEVRHLATYRANVDLLAELQDIEAEEEIARQLDEAVKEAAAHIT